MKGMPASNRLQRLDYCRENSYQLDTVLKHTFRLFLRDIAGVTQEFYPILRLAGFLQCYAELCKKVGTRLRSDSFLHVRTYACSAAEKLFAYYIVASRLHRNLYSFTQRRLKA